MYFPDFSNYSYLTGQSLPDVLNVGWLDQSMPFSKGTVPKPLVDQLKSWFRVARVNPMRGIHECNFCRTEQWPLLPLHENPSISVEDRVLFLGNWEIWIPASKGKVYSAPALIIHYVDVHGYCPPEAFISAAMNDDAMSNWNAEAEFENRTKIAHQ
jgi:hypothetical protein